MNNEIQQETAKAVDKVKLLLAALCAGGGIWAYGGVKGLPPFANLAILIGALLLALAITVFWTAMGRNFIRYVRASTAEIKKVVWPKRPDAVRMTGFVLVFVAVFAAFIYGVDSLIGLLFNLVWVKG